MGLSDALQKRIEGSEPINASLLVEHVDTISTQPFPGMNLNVSYIGSSIGERAHISFEGQFNRKSYKTDLTLPSNEDFSMYTGGRKIHEENLESFYTKIFRPIMDKFKDYNPKHSANRTFDLVDLLYRKQLNG